MTEGFFSISSSLVAMISPERSSAAIARRSSAAGVVRRHAEQAEHHVGVARMSLGELFGDEAGQVRRERAGEDGARELRERRARRFGDRGVGIGGEHARRP